MKQVNLFTSNLTGKQLITEKSETKKAVKAALADYEADQTAHECARMMAKYGFKYDHIVVEDKP